MPGTGGTGPDTLTGMDTSARNPWIVGRHSAGPAGLRLICVPQAGAGAGAFAGWRRHLPAGVELAPVELPGRGTRQDEPLPPEVATLADDLFQGLRPELSMPYVLVGHSLGGSLAYEVARRVEAHGLRAPLALVVSGSRAPHVASLRTMSDKDEPALRGWLTANGGLPAELLDYPSFLETILQAVRADLRYAESYLVTDPPALRCPLHVFGGLDDDITPPDQLGHWRRCAAGAFSVTTMRGGHSFPHADPGAMLAAIRGLLPGVLPTDRR
ncbi:thioesterase [Amorphoplanes digitatis]|nr:alpha/beta fold hydrolase [Actinoplanes digitatis]GID90959.1 thioesterase [Actinoplanes digitatis]